MLQLGNKITLGEPIYKFQNNHSVDFDGVNDFIQLGQPISYTQHTISSWIKLGDDGSNSTLIDARDSANDGWRIVISASQFVNYQINSNYVVAPSAISVDEWHHIVATYDGTTQKLYIDGSLVSSATTSQTISTTTNAEIGARNFSDRANEFLGKIDELAIWDRALTQAEVTEIYRIKYGANLVQNGRFDELGSEIAVNGTFDTSIEIGTVGSGWQSVDTLPDGSPVAEYFDGGVKLTRSSGITRLRLKTAAGANVTIENEKTYKLTYEVKSNPDNADLRVYFAGPSSVSVERTVGSHTFYITSGTAQGIMQFQNNTDNSSIVFDNVSIKKLDPNNRWNNIDGKFSFVNNGGKLTGTDSGQARLYSIPAPTSAGKTYKVSYTVVENNGTSLQHYDGDSYETITSTVGDHSFIYTRQGSNNNFILRNPSGASAFIVLTNIMLQEQKYVASNLKLNSGNYKSADPVIVSTKSVDFDGAEEYLEVTKKDFLGTSDFTISMWIKPDIVTEDNYFIGQSTDDDNRWYIRVRGSNSSIQFFSKNSGNNVISVLGGTPIANQWNHIVVTADRENECKLYVNNVLSMTQAGTTTASLTCTGNLRIGSFELFGVYFDGTIDDVGIFNAALSSDQVGELYNQGVPSNLATSSAGLDGLLAGYWKMGDGTLDEAPLIADQTNATLGSDVDLTTGSTTAPASWQVISANTINWLNDSNALEFYQTGFTVTTGKTYKITLTVSNYTGSNNLGWSITGGVPNTMRLSGNGTVSSAFVATGNLELILFGRNTNTGTLTVSVNEVGGNPALMINTPTIVTDAPLTKIRNYYRMGDGILDKFPYINDMISPNLAEITSTNLVTHSTDLDSSFSKNNVTLESNAIISPDGTQNASYVKATSSTSTHLISDIMGTNDVIAMSIHAKQGGYSKFRFNSGSSSNGFASFNLADGTIRTTGGTYFYNAEIEDVGDGWYRCKMVLIGSPGTSLTVAIEDDGNQVSFTGDTSKGIYFWGAQGEVQRQVTPLITTTGSTVTREATIENNYGSMINMSESDITNDVPS